MNDPSSLLDEARFRALRADIGTRVVLGIWTRLRCRVQDAVACTLPEPELIAPGVARLRLESPDPDHGHLELRLPARQGERFVGFGERFNAVDQRGWKLETWTEEGAIGFGETLSPLLTRLGVRFNPWPTGPAYAYKPLPWYMSSRGYGLLLETTAPVFYDVAATDDRSVACHIAAPRVDAFLFYGAEPRVLLERMTERTGRPPGLPDWALGPWNDAVGGQDEVRRVASVLRDNRIPSSVIWTEDWHGAERRFFGDSRWSLYTIFPVTRRKCESLYPLLEVLAAELHREGFKFLGYYYPYVHAVDPQYREMDARGLFLRDASGKTRTFTVFVDEVAQLDLTNPEAREHYARELAHGLALGFDGWMADFGEYTPVDTVAHDGEPGLLHHNRYPVLWAELNRQVLERARPDGDFVFFSRAAGLGQQAITPVFWCGDSNTDFERWDGLPSNLPALLSAGLSGISIWTTDVGGYKSLLTHARDHETFGRWVEMAAFLAVMRTHHGTHPNRSVQFDHDTRTLTQYATYARVHTALFPLRRALVDEAVRTGLPVCRPLLLEFPGDAASWDVEDQFMLGPHLLVAPVLERRADGREVYLPPGHRWLSLWGGERFEGGRRVWAHAPLGRIPVFLRSDGVVPTFDLPVDTLVRRAQVESRALCTLDEAETSLSLLIASEARGEHTLWDGSRIEIADEAPDAPGSTLPTTAPIGHALLPHAVLAGFARAGTYQGERGTIPFGEGSIRIEGARPRRWTLYLAR